MNETGTAKKERKEKVTPEGRHPEGKPGRKETEACPGALTLILSARPGSCKCLQTDPRPPRYTGPPGNALGSVRSDKTRDRKDPKGAVCAVCGAQRARDARGSVPWASSSPRICGVSDESRARLLLEDLGNPALGDRNKG